MEPTATYLLMIGQYAARSVLAVIHGTARDAHHAAAVMTIERAHRTCSDRPPGDLIAVDVEPVDVVDRQGSTVTAAVEPDPPTPTEHVTIRPNVVVIFDGPPMDRVAVATVQGTEGQAIGVAAALNVQRVIDGAEPLYTGEAVPLIVPTS